ncbi:hypothetical protein DAPPUDRAFT_333021 [Daphnia pulex]|uniref:Uncharacterized protein n=1 Tax=Daphnia pulex TaxID=6669 RepID=E9HRL7_DAPPU|nr:hypothetical protein DAPPUDRAFT_333021 [Daphnia pulex]|eukprot:EFX65615.1 hypothetical protein DAPPUDRAFT_333021 [Daphnia pulex]
MKTKQKEQRQDYLQHEELDFQMETEYFEDPEQSEIEYENAMRLWRRKAKIDCGLGFKTYLKNLENIHTVIPS